MEKAKRTFPSTNIRIEKNKDGTAIIHAREILWKEIFLSAGLMFLFTLAFCWSLTIPYGGLKIILLTPIAMIIVLVCFIFFIVDAKLISIRLESDQIIKTVRSIRTGQISTYVTSTIESVRSVGAYQRVGTQTINVVLQELILHFNNGNESVLLSKIPDVQTAVELRDFINHTYGLDEKSKNQ